MNNNSETTIQGPALYSSKPLSFWGGIDPLTGLVIDRQHPLCGLSTKHAILCLPSGRGSCTGSQVMLELILNGVAPRAVILREADVILCVGVIVAEEFFDVEDVPVICVVGDESYEELLKDRDGSLSLRVAANEDVVIETKRGAFAAKNLLRMKDTLQSDSMVFDDPNQDSHAKALSLKTIRRVASISSATQLIPIKSAHIDAVTYIGPGGLRFVQKLVQLGGKVAVPTTLNSQSVDRRRWQQLGVDSTYARNANSVGDAYVEMGCEEMSFTCAPYLLPGRPEKGDDIMWGESNAVVYSNSVLGARTEKYADYFDILAAIVGAGESSNIHFYSIFEAKDTY
jgi:predicted aconitase with swiveling domain